MTIDNDNCLFPASTSLHFTSQKKINLIMNFTIKKTSKTYQKPKIPKQKNKFDENAKNGLVTYLIWQMFENLKLVVKQCYQIGHFRL